MADLERAKQTAVGRRRRRPAGSSTASSRARPSCIADGRRPLADELTANADAALATATALEATVTAAVTSVLDAIASVAEATEADVIAALQNPLQTMGNAIVDMRAAAPQLPPLVGNRLTSLADVLATIVEAADLIDDVFQFVNGLADERRPGPLPLRVAAEAGATGHHGQRSACWRCPSRGPGARRRRAGRPARARRASRCWPSCATSRSTCFPASRWCASASTTSRSRPAPRARPRSTSSSTTSSSSASSAFVETLKDLIPFDGFSDPPFLDVTPAGLTRRLHARPAQRRRSASSPCRTSRSAPTSRCRSSASRSPSASTSAPASARSRWRCCSSAAAAGSCIRLSPDGLDVLELGLEAGAVLAVDFGVASGSISAMIGIYIRLEGDKGSLTGYFRLRGEVDVLGLISASIELYLELTYDFDTGKMIGRAQLTVEVEVLFFSASVTIECERQFAGSNGDPSFAEVMGVPPDGTSPAWSEYCLAFARSVTDGRRVLHRRRPAALVRRRRRLPRVAVRRPAAHPGRRRGRAAGLQALPALGRTLLQDDAEFELRDQNGVIEADAPARPIEPAVWDAVFPEDAGARAGAARLGRAALAHVPGGRGARLRQAAARRGDGAGPDLPARRRRPTR